jgi:hypothetical protein
MEILNNRVKRVHIGTHGPEIDEKLYSVFVDNGWGVTRFYRSGANKNARESMAYGEFGRVLSGDGIFSAYNPRFF